MVVSIDKSLLIKKQDNTLGFCLALLIVALFAYVIKFDFMIAICNEKSQPSIAMTDKNFGDRQIKLIGFFLPISYNDNPVVNNITFKYAAESIDLRGAEPFHEEEKERIIASFQSFNTPDNKNIVTSLSFDFSANVPQAINLLKNQTSLTNILTGQKHFLQENADFNTNTTIVTYRNANCTLTSPVEHVSTLHGINLLFELKNGITIFKSSQFLHNNKN